MASISSSPTIANPAQTLPLVPESSSGLETRAMGETSPVVSNEAQPVPASEGEALQAFATAGSPRLRVGHTKQDARATDPTDDPKAPSTDDPAAPQTDDPRAPLLGSEDGRVALDPGADGAPGAASRSARMLAWMSADLPVLALGTALTSGVSFALSFIFPGFAIAAMTLGAASAAQTVACMVARYVSAGESGPAEPPAVLDNQNPAEAADESPKNSPADTRAKLTGAIEDWADHMPTLRETTTGEHGFDLPQTLTRLRSSIDAYKDAALRTGYTNSLRNSLVQAEYDPDFRTRILPKLARVAGAEGDKGIETIMAMTFDLMEHTLAVRTQPN